MIENRHRDDTVPDEYEISIVRKDGSVRQLQAVRKEVLWGGDQRYQILYQDITDRKQIEEALRQEKDRVQTYLEIAGVIMVAMDSEGKVTLVNRRAYEILGYKANEIIGKNWFTNFLPERIREEVLSVWRRILAGEIQPLRQYENQILTRDGQERTIAWSNVELRDETGKIIGTLSSGEDVTERKQAEQKLRQASREWRTTFDSITDLISIHDKDNRIVRVNKALADMLITTPKELVGKFCHEVMHGATEPPANCPHLQTVITNKPTVMESYNPILGVHFQESTSPIFNEKGENIGSVLVARDVTKQKRMEEQLIMTDRLASIGELASGIAHELNNPLTSVIGFSQLMMEGDVPDNIKEDLATVYSEAQRAAVIVKNLLTFARKHAPVKQLSQVNTVVEDVLRLRAYEQKVNNIEIENHLDPSLPEIMIDHFQMQQVFLNLVVNAEFAMLEAHHRGKLVITTEKSDGIIKVIFTDDGPGIAKENLKRIFDPFFTTKEVGKGTGLGLSICHGIVTEHSGQIYARSENGQGATFTIELPLINEQ
jgi:PAS domain S-box-containing protein